MNKVKTYKGPITVLGPNDIFVFGSNLQGFHGGGAAGFATFNEFGNVWRKYHYDKQLPGTKGKWNVKGVAEGIMEGEIGCSYAIPTVAKAGYRRSLPLARIKQSVEKLYAFARKLKELKFYVAQEGRMGLNGYSPEEMGWVYSGNVPENIYFEESFAPYVKKENLCSDSSTDF